jgi:hypothetical protein
MTEAVLGQGVELRVGATTAATTATILLGGMTNIPAPPFTRGFVDVTAHDSPGGTREFIADLKDPGELSCTLNWTPGNATHDVLIEMMAEAEPRFFTITWPMVSPSVTCEFNALLTGFEPSGEADGGQLTASVTLRITGEVDWP